MKKILILTQYFPPETGAPQNRLLNLSYYLSNHNCKVTILTAMPNYPNGVIQRSYKGNLFFSERIGKLAVYRSWIYATKSNNKIKRLINYFSFAITSFFMGLIHIEKRYDLIICESPPLFLGITALLLKKIKRSQLLFNVSDLWPKSAEELGIINNRFLLNLTTLLEEHIYRYSDFITGQTQGIIQNISRRFNKKNIYWFPNGFNPSFSNTDIHKKNSFRIENGYEDDDYLIIYAGILGHAQGLENCLIAASKINNNKIKFLFFGTGPEEKKLKELSISLNLQNVRFFGHRDKDEINDVFKEIDAGLVPLKRLPIFLGAIPSKIFDILQVKRPLVLGVDGEAKKLFIDDAKAGLYYQSDDIKAMVKTIEKIASNKKLSIKLGNNGYNYIQKKFNNNQILAGFYNFINNDV